MNTKQSDEIEEFAKELSSSVRLFAGFGQYPDGSEEQKAYRDGVQTAIGMMYIDLTGTPKSKGMLRELIDTLRSQEAKRVEEARAKALLDATEILHKHAMKTTDTKTLSLIEVMQTEILQALTEKEDHE